MSDQYLRKVSLIVANDDGKGIELSDLRVKFKIRQWDIQTPNNLSARIYNLSYDTWSRIGGEFTRVVLQAGYENGNFGTIFSGTIIQARRGRENATDTFVDIVAADSDEAYCFAIVAQSLAAGAVPKDQIDAISTALAEHGVSTGYIAPLPQNGLPRGKVMFGMARDRLRDVARTTGTIWGLQDGKLQITTEAGYLPGQAVVLTAATGLIGLPEQVPEGVKARCLLNPRLRPAGLVQIASTSVQQAQLSPSVSGTLDFANIQSQVRIPGDGFYRVLVIDHCGDTRGNDWYSDLICIARADPASIALTQRGQG